MRAASSLHPVYLTVSWTRARPVTWPPPHLDFCRESRCLYLVVWSSTAAGSSPIALLFHDTSHFNSLDSKSAFSPRMEGRRKGKNSQRLWASDGCHCPRVGLKTSYARTCLVVWTEIAHNTFLCRSMETVRSDPLSQCAAGTRAAAGRLSVPTIPPIGCSRMLRVSPVSLILKCNWSRRRFATERQREPSPVDIWHLPAFHHLRKTSLHFWSEGSELRILLRCTVAGNNLQYIPVSCGRLSPCPPV